MTTTMANRCGSCYEDIEPLHMGLHLGNAHDGAAWIVADLAVANPYRLSGLELRLSQLQELRQELGGRHPLGRLVELDVERGILTAWEAELVMELAHQQVAK